MRCQKLEQMLSGYLHSIQCHLQSHQCQRRWMWRRGLDSSFCSCRSQLGLWFGCLLWIRSWGRKMKCWIVETRGFLRFFGRRICSEPSLFCVGGTRHGCRSLLRRYLQWWSGLCRFWITSRPSRQELCRIHLALSWSLEHKHLNHSKRRIRRL